MKHHFITWFNHPWPWGRIDFTYWAEAKVPIKQKEIMLDGGKETQLHHHSCCTATKLINMWLSWGEAWRQGSGVFVAVYSPAKHFHGKVLSIPAIERTVNFLFFYCLFCILFVSNCYAMHSMVVSIHDFKNCVCTASAMIQYPNMDLINCAYSLQRIPVLDLGKNHNFVCFMSGWQSFFHIVEIQIDIL